MKNGHTTRQKAPAGRYALLDELRGLDLVSMILYHACWDMMFLFGIWMDWYAGMPGRLWQQTICWVFILLSGFCAPFGRHMLRRGVTVFAAGALVTAVTLVFMPGNRVIFGVLTFRGTTCTRRWAADAWSRCAARCARRWAGWAGTRFCCICCTSR